MAASGQLYCETERPLLADLRRFGGPKAAGQRRAAQMYVVGPLKSVAHVRYGAITTNLVTARPESASSIDSSRTSKA